jgi:phosphatidate cytidylyltransferase
MADGFLRRRLANNPDLGPRLFSAFVIAPVALVPVLMGGLAMALFAGLISGVMAREFRLITQPGVTPSASVAYAMPVAAVAALGGAAPVAVVAAVLLAAAAAICALDRARGQDWRWGGAGLVTLGAAGAAFAALRAMEPAGLSVVLWIAAVVIATDVGAYAAGRAIGGPKLWPRVSPKKTWAGLGGGVLAATLVSAVFAMATTGTSLGQVCAVSALLALVAQGGDLAESAVKRHFGVKDASALIPGHGGALDRLDGFIAATLVVAVATWAHGKPVFLP